MSAEFERLHKKRVEFEAQLQSIWKKEKALKEEVKMLKEKRAVQELEERLRKGEFPTLHGDKAIEAICDFVDDLWETRTEDLTEKQMDALTELANGLILSIKVEKPQTKTPLEWNASPDYVRSLYVS